MHLEEDTARSQHDKGEGSLVDFNRAGVPLMELVTEPVIHDAKTAGDFARELQLLLRTLGISDANMERGEMRVEANISVSKNPEQFGTKVEVKNLNSFRSVEAAIEFEIARQIELLEQGGVVSQETRGWDENNNRTFTQRSKETAKDYRYFPDPDIPKIDTTKHEVFAAHRLAEKMPKLPENKRLEYKNLGLTSEQIEVILNQSEIDSYFASVVQLPLCTNDVVRLVANYLTSDVLSLTQGNDLKLEALNPAHFLELMIMLSEGKINSRIAKDLLPELFIATDGPLALASARGLLQVSDTAAIQKIIDEIISEQVTVVAEYKAGKEASLQYLIGQAMKKTKGTANPAVLKELFIQSLK